MSKKITFRELVESIAEETDNSKQFTHDFIKDFVDVIHDGLEQDGNVNIAGFGKFNRRRVDEREGYNPQTEEKMTIPAHNKIVFKPYKDVRELVNAPYKHLEPELIEEDATEEGSTDPEESNQTDFIPTGPPTSTQETDDKTDSGEEAPFDLDNQDDSASSNIPFEDEGEETGENDEDIIEFKKDDTTSEGDEINDELKRLLESSDQPEEEKKDQPEVEAKQSVEDEDDQQKIIEDEKEATPSEEDSVVEETLHQTEDLINESEHLLDSIEEDEKEDEKEKKEEPVASPSFEQPRSTRKRTSAFPTIMIAAGFILLLVAGGAWYFSLFPNGNQQEMASQESTPTSVDRTATNDQQTQSGNAQNNQDPQQTAGQNQNQSQSASSTATATSSDTDSENIEIRKGQTLWSLAEEKYGNPRLWPWIYGTNESVENPDLIIAGNSLTVPLPSGPDNSLNAADSVGVAKGFVATYRWYKDNSSPEAKNHLLGAKLYHENIRDIADVQIDEADLSYANRAR
jgi:nucleoid DNA-binding protein